MCTGSSSYANGWGTWVAYGRVMTRPTPAHGPTHTDTARHAHRTLRFVGADRAGVQIRGYAHRVPRWIVAPRYTCMATELLRPHHPRPGRMDAHRGLHPGQPFQLGEGSVQWVMVANPTHELRRSLSLEKGGTDRLITAWCTRMCIHPLVHAFRSL